MDNHKINITDLAKKTGLSITTVSRVLNGKAKEYRISKKTQQQIEDAAKKFNYIPNQFAANLRSGKSGTIALIVPSLKNPFFAEIVSDINAEIRKFGYITIIGDSDENADMENMELKLLIGRNIEGLIIVPCGIRSDNILSLYDNGLPLICIDRYFEELDIPYVSTDNYEGAYMATKHLIDNGHSAITCIQGVQHSTPNKLRVKGFENAMKNLKTEKKNIVGNDFTFENGYLETNLLLQKKEIPTAIFTLSNTIAMGCMKALKEKNIRIPEDISLLTFDDHPYLDYLSTPLSCIAQPVRDISKIAAKFILSLLNNKKLDPAHILLKPNLIRRDSVKKIK